MTEHIHVTLHASDKGGWIARLSNTGNDTPTAVWQTPDNGFVITGTFTGGTLTAYSSGGGAFPTTLTNSGLDDQYIVKYDSTCHAIFIFRGHEI